MEEVSKATQSASTTIDKPQKTKLGSCEVCQWNAAKYTCPKCEVKTCGLKCNKIHKTELECDGIRDRTKYVPLNKFTNFDLSSDYRLLEEITRHVETYKKDRLKKFTRFNRDLPNHLYRLYKAALERKITLKFLPRNFIRHKNNTSILHYQSNIIYWHVDWIFINADNLLLKDEKLAEIDKLSTLVSKYLVKQDDTVIQEKLQYYQAAGINGFKLFLKAEQKKGRLFYELDFSQSLKDNLHGKTIIEYPIIHVVLNDHCYCYDVIDTDDETDTDVNTIKSNKSGCQVVASIIKQAEKEELHKSSHNLLFVDDCSEGDLSNDE